MARLSVGRKGLDSDRLCRFHQNVYLPLKLNGKIHGHTVTRHLFRLGRIRKADGRQNRKQTVGRKESGINSIPLDQLNSDLPSFSATFRQEYHTRSCNYYLTRYVWIMANGKS